MKALVLKTVTALKNCSTPRDALSDMWEICFPRWNLMGWPSILIHIQGTSYLFLMITYGLFCQYWETDNLLTLNHIEIPSNSWFKEWAISVFLLCIERFVSSGNRNGKMFEYMFMWSLIYCQKGKEPKIESCATSYFINSLEDWMPLQVIYCCLSDSFGIMWRPHF